MISSLPNSLTRITIFWYVIGFLLLFIGHPDWAEAGYLRMAQLFPWVPETEFDGLSTAAAVQWRLLIYWTAPVAGLWFLAIILGAAISEVRCQLTMRQQLKNLRPTGSFGQVSVAAYSLGALPLSTVPALSGGRITFSKADAKAGEGFVEFKGVVADTIKMLSAGERQLCEELVQLLSAAPQHYAGLGHGVGLLAHTLNVVSEAAGKCTPEFRLPLLAAFAHDVGKLITFQPDGEGGWVRRGLHSRESARILATLPGFQELPEIHQRALILAVKYDHSPNKMPQLRGDRDASMLALRIINALSQADRAATADEKARHLERLQPEDLLWKDFTDFLREAPIATRGKKGGTNMVNNPPDSPYLFIYEAAWREAAIRRMPPEVAAALDLTRRDPGKLAKYTKILVERLRKEGLLLETHEAQSVTEHNPLWDIQSGTGEKSVVFRGVLALDADPLWEKLNYRLSVKSPFPVKIIAPNADADGKVNTAPKADTTTSGAPEVSDGLKLDISTQGSLADVGLADPASPATAGATPKRNPRARSKATFRSDTPSKVQDSMFGLTSVPEPKVEAPVLADQVEEAIPAESPSLEPELPAQEDEPKAAAPELEDPKAPPVEKPVVAVPPAPAPAPAPSMPGLSADAAPAPALSRTEIRAGLAIADAAAIQLFPHLAIGDKYFTAEATEVQKGTIPAGRKYKGNTVVPLTSEGPKRARRRF